MLCGVPIGLKDLYGVAGKPLTASSRLLDDVPDVDCDVWARLRGDGMVLLGHLHTHEFAVGGTTDQVGSPWALDRSAGGSSGGSSAALAARMTPAATGTDTEGRSASPRRCPAPRRSSRRGGCVSLPASSRCPRASTMPGRWRARSPTARCCCRDGGAGPRPARALARARRGSCRRRGRERPLAGSVASRRESATVALDPDVADGFRARPRTLSRAGSEHRRAPAAARPLDLGDDFLDVL